MECDGFRLTLKVFSFPRNAARLHTSRKLEVTICNFCNHDLRIRDIIRMLDGNYVHVAGPVEVFCPPWRSGY